MASSSNSGGGRRQPASLFPWLVPQTRPEPEEEESTRTHSPFLDFGNPPPPAKPKPEESTWTHSPYHDFGNPQPPPPSPPARQTSPAQQSSGQASRSDSDEQGSKGSSQKDDAPDADRGKDAISVQALLPDIAEMQDDFGNSAVIDGISPDHWHRYSNLDVLDVQQDIERRPLTFQRCFVHSESPRMAMEFIYAEPPKLSESELWYCQQEAEQQMRIRAGMAIGGAGDAYATDFTNRRSILRYEERIEKKYGFAIEWGVAAKETNMAGQLNDLAKSVAHVVDYLDVVYADDPQTTGISVFQQYFSQNEHGQLKIQLGADAFFAEHFENITKEDAPYIGFVPLNGTNNMYLGSMVDIATIVHEFGHVIDRSLSIEDEYRIQGLNIPAWNEWYEKTGLVLNSSILQYGIVGFAGKQKADEEFWADLFMTAVLASVVGGPLYVYSSTYDRIRQLSGSEFDHCEAQPGQEVCARRPVQWVAEEDYNIRNYTVLPKDQFPILLRSLLSG